MLYGCDKAKENRHDSETSYVEDDSIFCRAG